ncbi:hypothetical protein MIMGU_mgv11b018102mg [Erythranthe guttata]|uniref:DNA-directed RNA polymerase n=1 Tax=Erythranthe guttata TaxID=4155 RepID=A0A022QHW1_ERYGU|nr:hypothetical protein MIMGU_mgv11b018102mg [Erythranthe guttata]
MLITYGVERTRETILREVKHALDIYDVKIKYKHFSFIADYMTHTGPYLAPSRQWGISNSVCSFLKITFDTASKFILEVPSHGLTAHLETHFSKICGIAY